MANPNPKVEHLINHEGKNTFTSENQPNAKAKSEGVKKWWEEQKQIKKLMEEQRERFYVQLYKQAGFQDDGTSNLEIGFAQKTIKCLEEGNLKLFLDIMKDVLPEKVKLTDLTTGGKPIKPSLTKEDLACIRDYIDEELNNE